MSAEEGHHDSVEEAILKVVPSFRRPKCQLTGGDGNAFFVMGRVVKALRRRGYRSLIPLYEELATSGDYNHLLYVSTRFVDDVDDDDVDDDDDDEE